MLFLESIGQIFYSVIGLAIIGFIIKTAIYIFIIRTICKYMAKQNSKSFDYDFMARRTAEEICKRMLLIEKQKNNKVIEEEEEEETTDETTTPNPS